MFIAFLELIDAVNFDLLTVTRAVSICRINDDDRKWQTINYYSYIANYNHFFTAIRIGFQFSSYTYFEPEFDTVISNVTLLKENNVETEQVLSIAFTYTDGTAVITEDYTLDGSSINTQTRNIPSNLQTITV